MKKIIIIILFVLSISFTFGCDKEEVYKVNIDEQNYSQYFTIRITCGNVHDSFGRTIEIGQIKEDAQFDFSVIIVPNTNVEINAVHLSLSPTFSVKCRPDAYSRLKVEEVSYSCSPMSFNSYVSTYNYTFYYRGMYDASVSYRKIHSLTGTVTVTE